MSVRVLPFALVISGLLACAATWADERPAKSGGAKDAICLATLILEESHEGDAKEPSPLPPPPPPLLKRLADPGYTTIEDEQPASPFVEEKSPCNPGTPDDTAASLKGACAAPKATPVQTPASRSTEKAKDLAAAEQCQECQVCQEEGAPQWRLFDWPRLKAHRIEINGWLDQGITLNGYNPLNRFNGPVTFNDRSNEYQMNQFYIYAERKADPSQQGWDWGGRVDLLYGTDYRFTTARGLEDGINSGARFYGLAIPQFYLDLAKEDLTIRAGHFYTLLGYESVPAPNNFFYTHSYTCQYALPFTHTGVLGIHKLSENWTVTAGVHRGWDRFSDGDTSLLAGINWTSCDQRTTGALAVTSGRESSDDNTRTVYDLYVTRKIGEKFTYVFEHSLGTESNGAGQGRDANWYSLVNFLFYKLNDRWQLGVRCEWFGDEEAYAYSASAIRPVRGDRFRVSARAGRGAPLRLGELSLGVIYRPNQNFTFRSEVRWDWQTPRDPAVQPAFNDYHDLAQTLWANDVVFKF